MEYPLNPTESHEYLQERQGWSVKAMSDQIENQASKIIGLSKELAYAESRIAELQRESFTHDSQASFYAANAQNAFNLLSQVNCPNEDQAKINFAMQILNDVLISQAARKGQNYSDEN